MKSYTTIVTSKGWNSSGSAIPFLKSSTEPVVITTSGMKLEPNLNLTLWWDWQVVGISAADSWREIEAEDRILLTSGILPILIDKALQEEPSDDWERELNEL